MSDHNESKGLVPVTYVKGDAPHVLPMSVYIGTISVLMFLTFVTWAAAQIDIGVFNLPLAMLIASVKAFIVLFIFMHIAWDNKLNFVIIMSSFLFLGLFFIFPWFDMEGRTMVDVQRRNFLPRDEAVIQHSIDNPGANDDVSLQLRPKLQAPVKEKLNFAKPHH